MPNSIFNIHFESDFRKILKVLNPLHIFSLLIFQGRKRMGRWPSRSCLVCRTIQPLEVGTRTTAHQKLEATDPSPGQSGLKVECEAQANVFTGFTTKSWKRCVSQTNRASFDTNRVNQSFK